MLKNRLRPTKPCNTHILGRSMEQLAVMAGSSSPLPSSAGSVFLPGSSSSSSTVSTPLSAGLSSTSTPSKGRHRLATEPCATTRDSNEDLPKLATPKSPRTPTIGPAVMVHAINHRFTMTFKMLTVCDLCMKQMFIGTSLISVKVKVNFVI